MVINLIENICTFQGEGPDTGKRMLLLRFKHCDRICKWCDTLVKMRVQQEGQYTIEQLQTTLRQEQCGILITGGEPTFGDQLQQTIFMLNILDYPIANVETNGFQLHNLLESVDTKYNVKFIYSPKFFNERDLNQEVINFKRVYNDPRVYIKLVYDHDRLCRQFLDNIVLSYKMDPMRIFLMPQGKTKEELFKNAGVVFDTAEKYKVNFSSRTHLIYDFI
jgi:organic radical activating enzyme